MNYIAYVTKGLEDIVVKELIFRLPDVHIIETADKRILFATSASFVMLTELKTIDDLGIFVKKIERCTQIDDLVSQVLTSDFVGIRRTVAKLREIDKTNFSFTIGLMGVRNFSASDVRNSLSAHIQQDYQWKFTELDHTNFDIRIFIDHATVYVSVRLTKDSLYSRIYKKRAKAGSLKPTIAAAMLMVAELEAHTSLQNRIKVVDTFCGSGTILCEAAREGYAVYGGDIDPESVLITRDNLKNAGYTNTSTIQQLDATKTNLPADFFDCALSNLPWNKQVPVQSITNLYVGCLGEYARIVKPRGTICLLLTKPEIAIKYAKKFFPNANIATRKISFQGQQPTLLTIRSSC